MLCVIILREDRRLRMGWPCYDGVKNVTIMGSVCQDHADYRNGEPGVYCIPVEDSRDRFCMKYNIPEGASCGATVADVMTKDPQDIGYCQYPLTCHDGRCVQCMPGTTLGIVCDATLGAAACCEGTCNMYHPIGRSVCMSHDIDIGQACGNTSEVTLICS